MNSMPSLGSLNPLPPSSSSGSLFYHHPPPPPSMQPYQQQQPPSQLQALPGQGNFQPPLHMLPPQYRIQTQYRAPPPRQQAPPPGQLAPPPRQPAPPPGQPTPPQQKQWQTGPAVGTGGNRGGGNLYGYPDIRGVAGDQFFSSWMNPGRPTSDYVDQYYNNMQGQQNWPNIGEAEMWQKTQNPSTDYGGGTHLPPGMSSLLGDPDERNSRSEWPLYAPGSNSGTIGDCRGKLDPMSAALLQPLAPPNTSFGRHGPVQSELSFSSNAIGQGHRKFQEGESHHGGGGGVTRVNGRSNVGPFGEERARVGDSSGEVQRVASGKSMESGRSDGGASDGGPRKLVILRGLPGSGKTTLAR